MERDCMEDFAKAVLLAQEIREESWNEDKEEYALSQFEAADKAAEQLGFDKRATQPIYLLNYLAWNDIQWWAEKINS